VHTHVAAPHEPRFLTVRIVRSVPCVHIGLVPSNDRDEMTLPIESYALIGDCETAALVGLDGSIDWLCWPRFDSQACLAALLGDEQNGRWRLAPTTECTARRRYRDDTLVLETSFECAQGAMTVIDFMPVRDGSSDLVRVVVGRSGELNVRSDLTLRFDYGSVVPWVDRSSDDTLRAVAGPHKVVFRSSMPHHGEALSTASSGSRQGRRRASRSATARRIFPIRPPSIRNERWRSPSIFGRSGPHAARTTETGETPSHGRSSRSRR
jgi:hypothetical protein